jgi:hypothetical protein
MFGLNEHDTRFIYGGLIAIVLGVLGYIYAHDLAVLNFGSSALSTKGGGEKVIKVYTVFTKIVSLIIVSFSIYEMVCILSKALG